MCVCVCVCVCVCGVYACMHDCLGVIGSESQSPERVKDWVVPSVPPSHNGACASPPSGNQYNGRYYNKTTQHNSLSMNRTGLQHQS